MIFQISDNITNFKDSIVKTNRGKAFSILDQYGKGANAYVNDLKIHDSNFAFFKSELEKVSEYIPQPLHYVTYLKDIPVVYSGQFVDYVTTYQVDWNGLVEGMRATGANNANYLPRINAGLSVERVKTYTFEVGYDIKFLELEKISQIDLKKSLQDIYTTAIVASWDLFVQRIAYLGAGDQNGLFTHEKVMSHTIDNSGATKGTSGLSDIEVTAIFNNIFSTYIKQSGSNIAVLPDTILVPTYVAADLSARMSEDFTGSLRTYLSKFNLAVEESDGEIQNIKILGRKELDDLGAAKKGRIVAYRRNENFLRLDIPFPVQHYITLPNVNSFSYTTIFVGQVSEIQLPHNKKGEFGVVTYWDFTK